MKGSTQTSLVDIPISTQSVRDNLNLLKDDFSMGPDGVTAMVLERCASSLTLPLSILFREFLSSGVFSVTWKESFITPVHKSGSKAQVTDYRPVAKMSCIPKLFERLIYESIYFYYKSLFSPFQHGF